MSLFKNYFSQLISFWHHEAVSETNNSLTINRKTLSNSVGNVFFDFVYSRIFLPGGLDSIFNRGLYLKISKEPIRNNVKIKPGKLFMK